MSSARAKRQRWQRSQASRREAEGDTIYAIDRVAEHELVAEIGRTIATPEEPVLLVAEGLPGGEVVVPEGADRKTARWVIIVDPIDGTRGLMYQKRPAWILTGVARGPGPCTLADIELAVQTEIPLVKQHLSDELWAVRGQGASAVRVNRLTGEIVPLILHPSTATTLAHGFAMISRFFPGNRAELAAIDDEVVAAVMGPPQPGKAQSVRGPIHLERRPALRVDGGPRSLRRRSADRSSSVAVPAGPRSAATRTISARS